MEKGNRIINKIKLLMCVLCLFLLFGCKQRPEEVINTLKESISAWQEQYDLGVRYLLEGNYEEAIIAFSSAVEIDPKKPEAYLERANAYIESAGLKTTDQQEELYEKALADLEKAEELGDGKATEEDKTLFIQIQALQNGGEYEDGLGKIYDVYGREIGKNYYDENRNLIFCIEYEYNHENRRSKWTSYTPDGKVISEFQDYRYDEQGNEIRCPYFVQPSTGSLTGYMDRTYDVNGNIIDLWSYELDGTPIWHWIYQYDSAGKLTYLETRYPNGDLNMSEEYYYDERGYLVGITKYDGDGQPNGYEVYLNDDEGTHIECIRYNQDGTEQARVKY